MQHEQGKSSGFNPSAVHFWAGMFFVPRTTLLICRWSKRMQCSICEGPSVKVHDACSHGGLNPGHPDHRAINLLRMWDWLSIWNKVLCRFLHYKCCKCSITRQSYSTHVVVDLTDIEVDFSSVVRSRVGPFTV